MWLLPGGACMVALGGHAWLLLGACVDALGDVHGYSWGGMCGCSGGACVVASRGMHGCSWGACMVALGVGCAWDTTRYRDTINEQAVRILLECILVLYLVL